MRFKLQNSRFIHEEINLKTKLLFAFFSPIREFNHFKNISAAFVFSRAIFQKQGFRADFFSFRVH